MNDQPNQTLPLSLLDRLGGRAAFRVCGELVTPQRAALPNAGGATVDVYHLDVAAGFARLPETAVEAVRDALLDLVVNPPAIHWGGLSWSRELVAERQARLAQLPAARQRLAEQLRGLPPAEAR
ncbi:MAG: hypothetical protein KC425_13845, partial [Anaerolineales bacterium]|nr:hypothetical protein [Anaerolineales bacterium]